MISPVDAVAEYGVFLFSVVCHEAAHAYAADRLGDATARRSGLLTLNPLPHIKRSLWGLVLLPLMFLFFDGCAFGGASTPYDPLWARSYPRRAALMALAGPGANLALLLAAAVAIRGGLAAGVFVQPTAVSALQIVQAPDGGMAAAAALLLSALFFLNLVLLIFNIIPLPPFDGSAALGLFPGTEGLMEQMRTRNAAMVGFLALYFLFPYIFEPIQILALNLLFPGSGYR
jgi:Zn-dependent protease